MDMADFIRKIPKAELHLHIEGTLEPELAFRLAEKNGIKFPYHSIAELKAAYNFHDLQSFLDVYYASAAVLVTEQDFYDLTWNYLEKAKQDGVVHTEIFFDPQTHTDRSVSFKTVINGIYRALEDGKEKFGITYKIIMCFLRHLDEASAFRTLDQALPYKRMIAGVGLDSGERGNPPSKFKRVFNKAIDDGFLPVAHAGEEGGPEYVREAIRDLKVLRIDHGVRCIEDRNLMVLLANQKIPLTVCPLSNSKLKVYPELSKHPLKKLLDAGLCITVNSDDPAYFGGYIADNYSAVQKHLKLTRDDLTVLAINSITASFIPEKEKNRLTGLIREACTR